MYINGSLWAHLLSATNIFYIDRKVINTWIDTKEAFVANVVALMVKKFGKRLKLGILMLMCL